MGLKPCHSFSVVEFWLSLPWLRLSAFLRGLWTLVLTANIIQAQAVGPLLLVFGSKNIYGLGKGAQIPPKSITLLIPDDAANFHNCFGKQSLAGHRLTSAISDTIPCISFKIPHLLLCKISNKTLTCSLETPFQLIFGNVNDFTGKLSSCWTE